MSAFVVTKEHIDAMVQIGLHGPAPSGWSIQGHMTRWYHEDEWQQLDAGNFNEVGEMLVLECVRSVSARYPDNGPLPGPVNEYWTEGYTYTPGRSPSAVEALKLVSCYEYQSCEHEGWEDSAAHAFCESLRHSLIGELPGYDEAPWEWTDEKVTA